MPKDFNFTYLYTCFLRNLQAHENKPQEMIMQTDLGLLFLLTAFFCQLFFLFQLYFQQ